MKALTLALLLQYDGCAHQRSQTAARTGHVEQHSKSGRWYFAASGHAVYCYGPVMTLPQANGDIQKVATFCRDGRAVVPLKD